MAAAKPQKLKKNIEGFVDHLGIFHPIRSGNKEQGRLYDGQLAGDNDDVFDRQIRRAGNEKKAEEIYQKRLLNEALDGALGDERKTSLSQFVRKSGGLKYDPTGKTTKDGKKDSWYGELAAFSFKETGKKGLAHKNGKYGVDGMREQANEAGYPNMRTESDFLDALSKDLRTGDVYPFFSADYMVNPTTPANVWTGKAKEIGKAIGFFKSRNKPAKVKKLEKARKIAMSLASKARAEENATKRPKKNGFIETAASLAIVATGATELYDRFTKKQPVSSREIRRGDAVNPSKKVMAKAKTKKKPAAKKAAPKKRNPSVKAGDFVIDKFDGRRKKVHSVQGELIFIGKDHEPVRMHEIEIPAKKKAAPKKPTAKKNAAPVKNRAAASNVAFHEKEFQRFLNLIEKGDFSKQPSAKLQGKLAGYEQNEISRAIQYARLTYKLQKNPTVIVIKDADKFLKIKPNGAISRAWARRQAKKHYGQELRLKSALDRAKQKRAKQEAKAKKNPAKTFAQKETADRQRREKARSTWNQFLDALRYPAFHKQTYKQKAALTKSAMTAAKFLGLTNIQAQAKIADAQGDFARTFPKPGAAKKPVRNSAAFESFQGRPSTKKLAVVTPENAPKNVWCLGRLLELRLKGHSNLDFRGRKFYLCADEKNKQLWIAGGAIGRKDAAIERGYSEPIAEITHVVYAAHKAHLDDVPDQGYIHKFGEEGGTRPTLAIDRNGFPIITGGSYRITPLGIAD